MLSKRLSSFRAVAARQNLCLRRLGAVQQQCYSSKKQQQPQQQQQPQAELHPQQQQQLKQPKEQQHQQQLQQQQTQIQQQESPSGEAQQRVAAPTEVEWLAQELLAAKVEHTELLDKYKRALADGENMCRRLNKQIDDAKIFGIQGFCKDLIEVADVLGHATQAVPKDKLNANSDLKSLYEGLNLTRASLQQVFRRHGLETLDPIHEKFDPNLHEALYQTVDPTVEANTVVQVTKLGYKLHKRCIRPALVGVSKR